MSLPYFPMYPTDFEAKTSHLTLAEDGAYNRLLRICWMTPGCSMPADEAWIMRRARAVTDADQEAVRAVLSEFFTIENGRYSNARMTREFSSAHESHERRKNAGQKGGFSKALKEKEKPSSNAEAMLKQPEPEPEPYKPPTPLGGDFEEFWNIVPRKVGKLAAQKAYAKAVKSFGHDELVVGMKKHAASMAGTAQKFIPHPSRWLNEGRWLDEVAADTRQWHEKPEAERTKADRDAERMRWL